MYESASVVLIPFHSGLWVERLPVTKARWNVSLNPLSFGSLGRTEADKQARASLARLNPLSFGSLGRTQVLYQPGRCNDRLNPLSFGSLGRTGLTAAILAAIGCLNPLSFGSLGRTPDPLLDQRDRGVLIPFHSGLWVEQLGSGQVRRDHGLNPLSFGSLGRTRHVLAASSGLCLNPLSFGSLGRTIIAAFSSSSSLSLNPLSFGSLGRTGVQNQGYRLACVLIPFHSGLWVELYANFRSNNLDRS